MKLPYSLLLTTLTLGISFFTSTDASAFGGPPGGPFSNGSYFPNDGTFSAVIRGKNNDGVAIMGTIQFSTTSGSGPAAASTTTQQNQTGNATNQQTTTTTQGTGGVGSTGISSIYVTGGAIGNSYFGNSQGFYDPSSSQLSVAFQANAQGQGEQTVTQTKIETLITTTTVNGSSTTTETEQIVPDKIIKYFDSYHVIGSALCSTSNSFPNQNFKGEGVAEFTYLDVSQGITPLVLSDNLDFSVSGVRLSNVSSSFATKEVRPPSVNEQTILTNPKN
jgi:hypothetical protein